MTTLVDPCPVVTVPHMSDSGEISEDRGFKALVSSYPIDDIVAFVSELLSELCRPVTESASPVL
jgi:hypothetical protein